MGDSKHPRRGARRALFAVVALVAGGSTGAHAGTNTVIRADLSAADAARQVENDGGPTAAESDPVTFTGLVGGRPPFLVGDGHVIPCGRPATTAGAVQKAADQAVRKMVRLEYEDARDHVEEALMLLGCQKDIADAVTAARLYYLSGLIRIDQAWSSKASDDFAQALTYVPDFQWDTRFNPEEGGGAAMLETARARVGSLEPAQLDIAPDFSARMVYVDGVRVETLPVALTPGEHVVQLVRTSDADGAAAVEDATTVRVVLQAGGRATIAVPGLLEEAHTYRVATPHDAADILTVLHPVLGSPPDVWVATPTATWHLESGAFTQVATHRPRTRVYTRHNVWLSASGGLVMAGAATFAIYNSRKASQATNSANSATDYPTYEQQGAVFNQYERRYRVALGVLSGGAVVTLVGATVPLGRAQPTGDQQ